jgi:hypothetical protein
LVIKLKNPALRDFFYPEIEHHVTFAEFKTHPVTGNKKPGSIPHPG